MNRVFSGLTGQILTESLGPCHTAMEATKKHTAAQEVGRQWSLPVQMILRLGLPLVPCVHLPHPCRQKNAGDCVLPVLHLLDENNRLSVRSSSAPVVLVAVLLPHLPCEALLTLPLLCNHECLLAHSPLQVGKHSHLLHAKRQHVDLPPQLCSPCCFPRRHPLPPQLYPRIPLRQRQLLYLLSRLLEHVPLHQQLHRS